MDQTINSTIGRALENYARRITDLLGKRTEVSQSMADYLLKEGHNILHEAKHREIFHITEFQMLSKEVYRVVGLVEYQPAEPHVRDEDGEDEYNPFHNY